MDSFIEIYMQVIFCVFLFLIAVALFVMLFYLGKSFWNEIKEGL